MRQVCGLDIHKYTKNLLPFPFSHLFVVTLQSFENEMKFYE